MTSSRGGLMFGGPGNNSFFAAGPGTYEMIGGNWTNTFTISPSFNGVPATYVIDGGSYGQSKLVVRVPADENVSFENSTIADKYNPAFKALAINANAGHSATAHGIKKVQIIATSGTSVTIGDTSELNTEFGISGGAKLTFGGTALPDVFDVSTTGFFYGLADRFPVRYFATSGGNSQVSPSTWPRAAELPTYMVTRTFGTNGRTQSIPFGVSDAAASRLGLNAGGASDTYSITLGIGAFIDMTVNDTDTGTQNLLKVNVRDSVLRNNRVVLTDNELQLDYYSATIFRDFIPIGGGQYLTGYWTSAHYTPTVHFGANNEFTFATAFAFGQTTINRPLAAQSAHIIIDGQFTTTAIPAQSFGPQSFVIDASTLPITYIDFNLLSRSIVVQANSGTLVFQKTVVTPLTINVQSNSGNLTFDVIKSWTGDVDTYNIFGNSGDLTINSLINGTSNPSGIVLGLTHVVNVLGNAGSIDLQDAIAGTFSRSGVNTQVNVGGNGSLANVSGTVTLTASLVSYGLKIDDRMSAGPGTAWTIRNIDTKVGTLTVNHANTGGFFSKYEAFPKPGSPVTLFFDPPFASRELNGAAFPTWQLAGLPFTRLRSGRRYGKRFRVHQRQPGRSRNLQRWKSAAGIVDQSDHWPDQRRHR